MENGKCLPTMAGQPAVAGKMPARRGGENGFNTFFFLPFTVIYIFIISTFSYSQVKSNLDIFYMLADSSVKLIEGELPQATSEIVLEMNTGNSYSVINTQIINSFNSKGIKTTIQKEIPKVIYVIDNVSVKYDEMFRDGFLGSYLMSRALTVKGNYYIQGNTVQNFSYSYIDTVDVDDIKNIENISFPFTHGELPPEPLFSGLFEPVVAIGTSALVVILFFTIRSK